MNLIGVNDLSLNKGYTYLENSNFINKHVSNFTIIAGVPARTQRIMDEKTDLITDEEFR